MSTTADVCVIVTIFPVVNLSILVVFEYFLGIRISTIIEGQVIGLCCGPVC